MWHSGDHTLLDSNGQKRLIFLRVNEMCVRGSRVYYTAKYGTRKPGQVKIPLGFSGLHQSIALPKTMTSQVDAGRCNVRSAVRSSLGVSYGRGFRAPFYLIRQDACITSLYTSKDTFVYKTFVKEHTRVKSRLTYHGPVIRGRTAALNKKCMATTILVKVIK